MSLIKRLAGVRKQEITSDVETACAVLADVVDVPESTFSRYLEAGIKNQISTMLSIATHVHGIKCKVYNPVYNPSVYDSEDQRYVYEETPAYSGKILISGLPFISYSGRDQWSNEQIRLFWNQPAKNNTEIKEKAKIVVDSDYRKVSLRSKTLRRHTGRYFEFLQIHELVPHN